MRKEKLEELKRYVEELKVDARKEITNSKGFLNSKTYLFHLNNGRTIVREKLFKGSNDGSALIMVPVTSDNEIVMVIEPRVFTEKTVSVGFPAGYLEKGESVYEGAKRELREETGYISDDLILIDSFYQDEGISSAYNHIFLVKDCQKKYLQELDPEEIIKIMTFSLSELEELEELGYINSANTKLALAKTKKYLK